MSPFDHGAHTWLCVRVRPSGQCGLSMGLSRGETASRVGPGHKVTVKQCSKPALYILTLALVNCLTHERVFGSQVLYLDYCCTPNAWLSCLLPHQPWVLPCSLSHTPHTNSRSPTPPTAAPGVCTSRGPTPTATATSFHGEWVNRTNWCQQQGCAYA